MNSPLFVLVQRQDKVRQNFADSAVPPGYIRSKNEFVSLGCILNNLIGKLFPYRMQKTEI